MILNNLLKKYPRECARKHDAVLHVAFGIKEGVFLGPYLKTYTFVPM
jgi:hypothetical protein